MRAAQPAPLLTAPLVKPCNLAFNYLTFFELCYFAMSHALLLRHAAIPSHATTNTLTVTPSYHTVCALPSLVSRQITTVNKNESIKTDKNWQGISSFI